MAVPYVPTTHSDAQSWTAAKANLLENAVRDAQLMPAVRVFHNTTQSITTATFTALAFNSERFDTFAGASDTQHDTVTNNSRLTCRYAGVYQITGWVLFAGNATGTRYVEVFHQGTTVIASDQRPNLGAGTVAVYEITTLYNLAVNEYVELRVFQDSGGGLNVNANSAFMMVRVA